MIAKNDQPEGNGRKKKTDKIRQPNTRGRDNPKQAAFLACYAECGSISRAAKIAEVCRDTHYDWIKNDSTYAARFDEAHSEACEALEREARRRAVEGVERPVFQGGEQVGVIREYSDTLLQFLLKGGLPDKYRERKEVTQSGQVEHQIVIVHDDNWYGNSAHEKEHARNGHG